MLQVRRANKRARLNLSVIFLLNMNKLLKILITLLVISGSFGIGYVFSELKNTDILCTADPVLAVTTKELKFKNVTVSEGALIALKSCEYMDRFNLKFILEKKSDDKYYKLIDEPFKWDSDFAGGVVED